MFTRLLVAEGRNSLFRLHIGICESKALGLCNLFGPNCESAQDYERCSLKCGKFVATFAYSLSQIKKEAIYERSRVNVEFKPLSTFTFTEFARHFIHRPYFYFAHKIYVRVWAIVENHRKK